MFLALAILLSGNPTISNENGGVPTDALRASDLIEEIRGGAVAAEEFILVEAAPGDVDNVQLNGVIEDIVTDLRALDVVASAVSYLDGAPLLSEDGTKALIQVASTLGEDDDLAPADPILDLIADANANSGLRVTSIGSLSVNKVFAEMVEETFTKGEVIGVSAALVIMVGVFGAVLAPLMPILLAIVAILTAVGIIATISMVMGLSEFTLIVTTMVGLAVGIDYSLFIVQRFRGERDRGLERFDAIAMAGATASRTVLFSGVAVAIALAGMLVMPDILFKNFGIGTIAVVVTAVTAALTLLPALLGLLGDRINWLTVPIIGKRRPPEETGGVWAVVTRIVAANPVIAAVGTAVTILFGLSMDYHVFLLSRIKERYDETHDNSASVAYGLHSTASIITGAALIMVAVFGGFALGPLSMFQQMGFGLAVAVILDATIIRMILVPASMALLGDRNWYFPSWLEWLPKISIEGDHTRPAPAPAPSGASGDDE